MFTKERSKVGALGGQFSTKRISEQAWLREKDSIAADRITRRIDNYLGLLAHSSEHSELYQVANYGLGGQYGIHTDQRLMDSSGKGYPLAKRTVYNIEMGDRMATVSRLSDA